ncbi:MAG: response regulator [Balneolaceae bacterium]|nr:response regulator [Balneolaceae bacterium]
MDLQEKLASLLNRHRPRSGANREENTSRDQRYLNKIKEILSTRERLEHELNRVRGVADLKEELLMNIIHDVRMSLTLLNGAVSQVEEDLDEHGYGQNGRAEGPKARNRRALPKLSDNIDGLKDGLELMMQVSELRVQDASLRVDEIEFGDFLRNCIAFFRSRADQKNITIETILPEQEVYQTVDPGKFEKIFLMLLSVMINATPGSGLMRLRMEEDENDLRFALGHTGMVMEQEEADRILGPSKKAYASLTSTENVQGAGIRLSVIRKYVELHEGEMEISCDAEEGTVYRIRLPRISDTLERADKMDASPPAHPAPTPLHSVMEELTPLYQGEKETTVLVVDDDPQLRTYIASLLRREGMKTELASNGKEAQKLLALCNPDLVISDIMMPEMDGFELAKAIRKDGRFRFTPIILVSAKADVESRIYGYDIGISDYLVKPFNESAMTARVHNLLRQKERREQSPRRIEEEELVNESHAMIERLKAYVESRINDDNITITELADAVNKSRRQLYRDVKAMTGYTPAEFVREVKLRRARRLFESSPRITVAEVSNAVGYNTVRHFSKIFRNRFGLNPSEFKKQLA